MRSLMVAEAEEPDVFTPPPGGKARKRGGKVVYGKKNQESGTRFASESCHDEAQLESMEVARQEDQMRFEQVREVCPSLETCGGG